MTERPGQGAFFRVAGIAVAIGVMIVAVLHFAPSILGMAGRTPTLPLRAAGAAPVMGIPEEAFVFRTGLDDHAAPADAARRPTAHLRTLEMFRTLRAYPGAPPRIPHGLTGEEFLAPRCNACHERGGYVARFASYAPVTPHPEYAECMQCHVPDDRIVGIGLPGPGPDDVCLQCHVPDAAAPNFRPTAWRAPEWPRTGQRALPGAPPVIPHTLQLRGDCLACHMGPAAVDEIRKVHPERANCRQCHVPAVADTDVFTRPLDRGSGGGTP
jgi:nitrate reductase (cytochrome), electron transfer subunit